MDRETRDMLLETAERFFTETLASSFSSWIRRSAEMASSADNTALCSER